MSYKHPIHLLIRFSNSLLKDEDTIEEHNNIVHQYGYVWFGKMGSTVAQTIIDTLNDQVHQEKPTFVYLVKGNRRKSVAYRGRLILASKTLPEGEKQAIPVYYTELNILYYMKFWVKLSLIEPLDLSSLYQMQVTSSFLPIRETLTKSSSGHFILSERKF